MHDRQAERQAKRCRAQLAQPDLGTSDACSLCGGDWAACFAREGECEPPTSAIVAAESSRSEAELSRPMHSTFERFAIDSDDPDGVEELPDSTNPLAADDEQWWLEVEEAIDTEVGEDGYFAHAPTIAEIPCRAGTGCRRRISAKRPALPSETEARPSKKRRPG